MPRSSILPMFMSEIEYGSEVRLSHGEYISGISLDFLEKNIYIYIGKKKIINFPEKIWILEKLLLILRCRKN